MVLLHCSFLSFYEFPVPQHTESLNRLQWPHINLTSLYHNYFGNNTLLMLCLCYAFVPVLYVYPTILVNDPYCATYTNRFFALLLLIIVRLYTLFMIVFNIIVIVLYGTYCELELILWVQE